MIKYLFIIVGSFVITIVGHTQGTLEGVDKVIDQTSIESHLFFLGSDALRGRDTGSEGAEAAATYIASQFLRNGVQPLDSSYYQQVPFATFAPPPSSELVVGVDTLIYGEDYILINGKEQSLTAPSIFAGYAQDGDLQDLDVRFKLVVSFAGDGVSDNPRDWAVASREKRKRIQKLGGVGLIEIYQSTRVPWHFLKRLGRRSQLNIVESQDNGDLPNAWVGTTSEDALQQLKESEVVVNLRMDGVQRDHFQSANVVGLIPGSDTDLQDEYMVFSAHYDHVGVGSADATGDTIYNGIRDNAVGVTGVLSLAEYFSQHPPKRNAMFVLFTGEEKGLLGSSYFTDHLPVPADQIKFNYNIDNGGYNDTSIVSVIGLTRTSVESVIQEACNIVGVKAIEDPAKEQGLFDRSDNVNFARLGIPAPTFSLGFRAFDSEIFKYYHRPGDELHTVDLDYIEKYVKSYVLSADHIINGAIVPFWNAGDKYYKVGMELYRED